MTRDAAALAIITKVLANEGGVATLSDGAGVTRFGQTTAWLAAFGLPTPTDALSAAMNYQTWLVRTGLIGVCDYPDAFALAVVDFAVNSGHRTAIRELQLVVGVKPDGVYGPETQAGVDQIVHRGKAAQYMLGSRLRFLGRLISGQPERQAKWAAGWMNRVASQVEALA